MDTDKAFIESIEAGGDGILVRPFSPAVFKAKIKSIQRISDLYQQVKVFQQEQQHDAELAEKLMSDVIESRNYALDKIGIIKKAAELFSGDIQLSALCPNGNINVLLGDFTGHGLRSAIGAIPLAETFRAMSRKGFSPFEIIKQVNHQMYDLLPVDLFLGAAFVTISSHDGSAYIFNAGLPDVYLFSEEGDIKSKFESSHPPMGILPDLLPDARLTVVPISEKDRVILISDGIVEARNEEGEMYEFERFEHAAKRGVVSGSVSESVLTSVNEFCLRMPQEDDISLIDIPCGGWEQTFVVHQAAEYINEENPSDLYDDTDSAWRWRLALNGSRLSSVNPIPMAMSQINEIEGNAEHWQSLYTILTELFVNALDHGVLGLDSELKTYHEGFIEYFKERESRLKVLDTGFVEIQLSYHPFTSGGRVKICIQDSGKGFSLREHYQKRADNKSDTPRLSGRGIELVEQLCESLEYKDNGTLVEASYVWTT